MPERACLCCGHKSDAQTCPECGEASWSAPKINKPLPAPKAPERFRKSRKSRKSAGTAGDKE